MLEGGRITCWGLSARGEPPASRGAAAWHVLGAAAGRAEPHLAGAAAVGHAVLLDLN